MTDRVMLRADANENTIAIRTVSARMKSPQRFLVTYDELNRLRQNGNIISSDIHSFVNIRIDETQDRIVFRFTWLTGHSFGRVEGTEQTVTVSWSKFREFLDACRQPDGPKTYRALSQDTRRRPRLIFAGNRANLRAVVANRHVRRKLGKALMLHFDWPDADEIRLMNDFVEVLDDDNKFLRKADIFTKRTIRQHRAVTHADTAPEALAVSIAERARVDLPFMSRLTGKPESELIADLRGVIFKDPVATVYQTADEYLSGNVRRKLREAQRAAETDPAYQVNVDALAAAQPKDLDASEIEVRLGATWIAPEYIQQFMQETFRTPTSLKDSIRVVYVKAIVRQLTYSEYWIATLLRRSLLRVTLIQVNCIDVFMLAHEMVYYCKDKCYRSMR